MAAAARAAPGRSTKSPASRASDDPNLCGLLQKQDCTPTGLHPRLHVRPEVTKNGRSADLPMLPDCAERFRLIWEKLKQPTDPLFTDRHAGYARCRTSPRSMKTWRRPPWPARTCAAPLARLPQLPLLLLHRYGRALPDPEGKGGDAALHYYTHRGLIH